MFIKNVDFYGYFFKPIVNTKQMDDTPDYNQIYFYTIYCKNFTLFSIHLYYFVFKILVF